MFENDFRNKIELNDIEVLYPDRERYDTEDKDVLIAILHDKDNLISRLWFELKATREQEELCREYIEELRRERYYFNRKEEEF